MKSDFHYRETLGELREARRQTGQGMWSQAIWISTSLIVANATPLAIALQAALDGRICEPDTLAPVPILFAIGLVCAICGIAFWYGVGMNLAWLLGDRIGNHIRILDSSAKPDARAAFEENEAQLACKQKNLRGLMSIHFALLAASVAFFFSGILTALFSSAVVDSVCVSA